MSEFSIQAHNLSKQFKLGQRDRRGYKTIRDSFSSAVRSTFRGLGLSQSTAETTSSEPKEESFWALNNISFEVKRGQIIGVIGPNGAGKSTLLKILSRITEPTSGHADIHGRLGSLLEVGTGFHPELTGRENTLLNGAILGMSKSEVTKKFDEIVAFAEVEKFIDTPVKHYSSGMYLRLAFAVAAHLDTEILLVDEVLAVGDMSFQKKCLGKMKDVTSEGKTVLFVSHNMSAISNLCSEVYLVKEGKLVSQGAPVRIIQEYLAEGVAREDADLTEHTGRNSRYLPLMTGVRLFDEEGPSSSFITNEPMEIEVHCDVSQLKSRSPVLGFLIKDGNGTSVFGSNMNQYNFVPKVCESRTIYKVKIPTLSLAPGTYSISLFLGNGISDQDVVVNAIYFDVVWSPNRKIPNPPGANWGPLLLPISWEQESELVGVSHE